MPARFCLRFLSRHSGRATANNVVTTQPPARESKWVAQRTLVAGDKLANETFFQCLSMLPASQKGPTILFAAIIEVNATEGY